MKKRIKDTPISNNELYNEFYNTYRKSIDWFFGERKEETVYIRDEETVKEMERLIGNVDSNIIYLIGPGGIGKTTLLKKEYKLLDNAVRFDEERKIIFSSLGFRGQLAENDIKKYIANTMSNLCDSLENEMCWGMEFYTIPAQLDFYDYISSTAGHFLGYVKKTELIGKNETEAKILRLDKGEENDPFTYSACRLKYYLYKYCVGYKKLILVVDNIEAFKDDNRKKTIRDMLGLFSCLLNTLNTNKDAIPIDVIFSLQDKTFASVINEEYIKTYKPFVVVHQTKPVDIIKYIQLKHQEIIYNSDEERELGQCAYKIIDNFNKKFDYKYSSMITNLSNYDFQIIKNMYKKIFVNKIWVMKGNRKKDFLDMSKSESLFNNISVIRALACGNNAVYRGIKSKIIPNIFLNDEVNDASLICLLLIKYVLKNDEKVRYKKLIYTFKSIFSNRKILDLVEMSVEHFITNGIFDMENENEEQYLLITPRGKELWEMFISDSVLLEMYKEDHFLEESNEKIVFVSSYDLTKRVGQYEVFKQLLYYLEFLLKKESFLRKTVFENGKLEEYKEYFGPESQIERLLEGVIKSIEYSGNMDVNDIRYSISKLKEKIENIDRY